MQENCKNCMYYELNEDWDTFEHGQCFRFPPVYVGGDADRVDSFRNTLVGSMNVCGEWRGYKE